MNIPFLSQLVHLDAHFAVGIHDDTQTQHLRLVASNGELTTICGATFFDWVRNDPAENLCQSCLEDMAYWLLEQEKPKPLKLEEIDWTKERNLVRLRAYENRN